MSSNIFSSRVLRFFIRLRQFSPIYNYDQMIPGLLSPVNVKLDRFGIPSIHAMSRADAMRALGYVTAQARLFQMDLLRRIVSGRLSEIFGSSTLVIDTLKRTLGFYNVARQIVVDLPASQREALDAYVDGVNAYIANMIIPPLECVMLRYWPEPWTAEDSILVGLYIMDEITGIGEDENERMMTIMSKTLPSEVFAFLTPDDDCYAKVLIGGKEAWHPVQQVPVQALTSLYKARKQIRNPNLRLVHANEVPRGSNAWVISKCKTIDGRAILANDMHLPLSVPNIWYRACLHYEDISLTGLVLPGLPIMIAGSNGSIAWGSTNINGDFLDLVELEINPLNSGEYKTPDGWKPFKSSLETIHIKGGKDVTVETKVTIWGPVSPYQLLGHPVAVRWTALDPNAVNIDWIHIDKVQTVDDAVKFVNKCGGPPLNVMLTDNTGHIAWTLCGKIPIRKGFDGSVSQSWADGKIGWEGYIPPDQLPRLIDPPSGYLVTANNRTIGKQYPYVIGHHFANGYRAHYISQHLLDCNVANEQDFVAMQLDTTSKFYDFYRDLVLDLLTKEVIVDHALLREARQEIEVWDGKAELGSRGIGILIRFRDVLVEEIFGPILESCREADEKFRFRHNFEDPLRMIITERSLETLPDPEHFSDWRAFLIFTLEKTLQQLKDKYNLRFLKQLIWARMNITYISHPLSSALPGFLKGIFDMPRYPLPGCVFCIRVSDSQHGASMRMVISPGHEDEGTLHLHSGQSGRPLSRNYKDQHLHWALGQPLPFLPGKTTQEFKFVPIAR